MQFSVIADCSVTGVYRYNRAVVIIGACAGEEVKNLVVTGVRMFSDGIARGKYHVVEHSSLAVQFCITDGDFAHFRLAVSAADAFEFYCLFLFCSDHDVSPFFRYLSFKNCKINAVFTEPLVLLTEPLFSQRGRS